MLTEIRVRGLGVIEEATVEIGPGMTALTGETGAGKTLVVEALGLLAGGRADPSMVRPGSDKLGVEGLFEVDETIRATRAEDMVTHPDDDGVELILAREVPVSGRSRAWLNGRMATVSALAEWGSLLIDIHGQHDHMSLTTAAGQCAALDTFCGVNLGSLALARKELADASEALAALGGDPEARRREADLLRHQISELDAAGIDDPGEEDRLAEEEDLLATADDHREAGMRALDLLAGDTETGTVSASTVADMVGAAIGAIGGRRPFSGAEGRLRDVADQVVEAGREVRAVLETVRQDPARLEELRARRRLLFELARKYGGSLEHARRFRESARQRLEELERHDASAHGAAGRLDSARGALSCAENEVRQMRTAGAPRFAEAVTSVLTDLAMPKAAVEVEVADTGAGEPVAFLLAANPGEPALPLAKVASGGELARASLAVRLITSGGPPTLVFDEADAGIGGESALAVGRALAQLSHHHQVVVVTHLPQVAAFADRHLVVTKSNRAGRTVAKVTSVTGEARVVELSRMLSGHPDSAAAHRHAEELLQKAGEMRGPVRQR